MEEVKKKKTATTSVSVKKPASANVVKKPTQTKNKKVENKVVKQKPSTDKSKDNGTVKEIEKNNATKKAVKEANLTQSKKVENKESNKPSKSQDKNKLSPKKLKIIIVSIILSVVLLGGGLITFFILYPRYNYDLLSFLGGVGNQIEQNHSKLADSFNDKENSGEVFLANKNSSLTLNSLTASPVSDNNELWEVVENENTFEFYLSHINNVMGYYAISEYLVENLNKRDFSKSYYYSSSVITYYAKAEQNANFFKLILHNDNEDVDVIVNRDKKSKKATSIEFISLSIKENKNLYFYAQIDLNKNTYTQINLTSSVSFPQNFDEDFIESSVSQFEYYFVSYSDISSFVGIKMVRKSGGGNSPQNVVLSQGNNRNAKTKQIKDKVSKFGKAQFQNVKKRNFNKNNLANFPNPEDLHSYAFSKYSVTLETGVNGKKFLATRKRGGINQDVLNIINNYKNLVNDNVLHSNYDLINYIVNTQNTKVTISEFMPEFDVFITKIKNWLSSNSYNKNQFYYKANIISNNEKIYLGNDRVILEVKGANSVTYINIVANNNNFLIEHINSSEQGSQQNYVIYFENNIEGNIRKSIDIRKTNFDLTFNTLISAQQEIEEESFNCVSQQNVEFAFEVNLPTNQPNYVEYFYAGNQTDRNKFVGTRLRYADSSLTIREETKVNTNAFTTQYYLLKDKIENNTIIKQDNTGISYVQAEEIFENYTFTGSIYSWQYKQGFTVVSQLFNNTELDKTVRSINLSNFGNPNNRSINFVVEKDGKKYGYNYTIVEMGDGNIGGGGLEPQPTTTQTFNVIFNGLFNQEFQVDVKEIVSINFKCLQQLEEDVTKMPNFNSKLTVVDSYKIDGNTVDNTVREFDCSYGNFEINIYYFNEFNILTELKITVTYENI